MTEIKYDVVAVGNAIVDVLAQCEPTLIAENGMTKGVMQLVFSEDEANKIYSIMPPATEQSGGSAANSIAGIAALGGKTAMIAKVADDDLGKIFTHDMKSQGVYYNTETLKGGPSTGRCMVLITPDADRTMNTYLGASVEFSEDDIDEEVIKSAKVTYLEGYLFDKDTAKAAFYKAAKAARSAGRKVALTLSDPFCVDRHRDDFLQLIEGEVDILFCNQDELKSLYQTNNIDEALMVIGSKVETVAVTRSEKGSVIIHKGEKIEVAAVKTEVVDTTGAGDLFAGGFLFGYTRDDMSIKQAGMYASAAAAEIIAHIGARPRKEFRHHVETVLHHFDEFRIAI